MRILVIQSKHDHRTEWKLRKVEKKRDAMILKLLSVSKQESSMRILKIGLESLAKHDEMFKEKAWRNTYIEIPSAEELRKERLWENIEEIFEMRIRIMS